MKNQLLSAIAAILLRPALAQRSRRGGARAARIIRSSLGFAGFFLFAVSSGSAAPDWCRPNFPFYPPDVSGHYFQNNAEPLEFSVNVYNPGGPYTQAVAVSISGYGTLPCHITPDTANFVCDSNPLPLLLSEGEHTASYTCNAVDSQGNAAGSHTEQISFGIDNSSPVVTFASPAPGTTFSPFSTITVSGSIRDFSPVVNLSATSSNGPPSASRVSGNNFAFDFCLASSTNNFFSTLSTTVLSVHIGAFDSVGLGNSDLASIAVTLDGVPPSVSVSTPLGTVKTFAAISGTASDASGIAEIRIAVRNMATGKYWNGSGFGISTSAIFLAVAGSSQWSFPLQSRALPAGQIFAVYVAAKDILGNRTDPDRIVATFTIPQSATLIAASGSGDLSGLFSFSPSSRDIQYGGDITLCAQINPNADAALRGIAANEVVFETRTGAIRPFRNPGDGLPSSVRLSGNCGQNGVPIKIFSDPRKCLGSDRIIAKVFGAIAGFVDIVVLLPTETESRILLGRIDGIFNDNPKCGPPSLRCAIDEYFVAFTRNPVAIDLFGQKYREFVSTSRQLVLGGPGGTVLPFCDKRHQSQVQQQEADFFFGDHQNTILDRTGIIKNDSNDPDLIGSDRIAWVANSHRPWKCGAEVQQYFKVNACRVPRDPAKFIRQRIQIIVAPHAPSSGVTFTTSRSDEKNPHGTLDSQ